MIQNRSVLTVADNSGAKLVQCIRLYKSRKAAAGSLILVAIKEIKAQSKIKKGELYKGVIVRLSTKISRRNGNYIKASENAIVLLNSKNEFFGTRLNGPITNELRKKKHLKILSLTTFIV